MLTVYRLPVSPVVKPEIGVKANVLPSPTKREVLNVVDALEGIGPVLPVAPTIPTPCGPVLPVAPTMASP
jgi:hypothetical protein